MGLPFHLVNWWLTLAMTYNLPNDVIALLILVSVITIIYIYTPMHAYT